MSRHFDEWYHESGQYTLDDPCEYLYLPIGDGFDDYAVCKDGFVCNKDGHILRKRKGDKAGHESVCMMRNGKREYRYIHRLVAEAFIPNPDNLPIVRHLDDDRSNNCVDNLAWGTQKDNYEDSVRNGTHMPFSDEARKMSIEKCRRPVRVTDIRTGKTEDFYSLNEACRQKGIVQANACAVLRGARHSANGYFVAYLEK